VRIVEALERAEHQLQERLLAESIRPDLRPPTFFANKRSIKFVVRVERRCVTGRRRWAMQGSKSSSKHLTAVGKLSA